MQRSADVWLQRKFQVETEVENWIQKFDADMGERQVWNSARADEKLSFVPKICICRAARPSWKCKMSEFPGGIPWNIENFSCQFFWYSVVYCYIKVISFRIEFSVNSAEQWLQYLAFSHIFSVRYRIITAHQLPLQHKSAPCGSRGCK